MSTDPAMCDSCWWPLDEMDLFEMDEAESAGYVICSDCMDEESRG